MVASPTTETARYDVLLCYNHVDVSEVKRLQHSLGGFGIHCWVDYDQPVGTFWRNGVKEGYARSKCAVVVLGSDGTGKSQIDEIRYLISSCGPDEKPLIFVVLPNGDKSCLNDVGTTGLAYINALDHADDPEVVDRIRRTLDPDLLPLAYRFGLFRGLKPRPRSCFLAIPRVMNSDMLPVFRDVALGLGCTFSQDADVTLGNFVPDVLNGVANSSMVLADCRCLDGTNHLDPGVGHVLGIARAYGKPIIIVIDPVRQPLHPTFTADVTLEHARVTTDGLEHFKLQLGESISRVLKSLKYHGMVSQSAKDMLVILHGALTLKPPQRKFLVQAIDTCRTIADEFSATGHLLSALSVVAHEARVAEEDGWPRNKEAVRWWREFNTWFAEHYCQHYVKRVATLAEEWGDRKKPLILTAGQLLENEHEDVGKALGNARDFLVLMATGIERFQRVHDNLVAHCAPHDPAWPMGPPWYFKQLEMMREYADEVVTNALSTITSFLPLLGHEPK